MVKKKRILQLNLNGEGGAFSLIYQLQKCLSDNYVFDYYYPGKFVHNSKFYELIKMKSEIYDNSSNSNKIIQLFTLPFAFYNFLKEHDYDVVHVNGDLAYKMLLYALPAHKAGVKKIIIHSHSSSVNGKYKLIKKMLHYCCKPFLPKNANVFLKCSSLAGDWMFNKKVDSITLKNGVDLKKYRFDLETRKKIRLQLKIKNRVLLGTIGDYSYAKNPEYFIKILKLLPKKYMMLFIGDGKNRENIETFAKKMGVYERCIFYGRSNHVDKLLNAMDIYIMTSRFEGLPVSAVEAQANGLATILSSNITSEVQLLPDCKMLSISNENLNQWITVIKNVQKNTNRENAGTIIKKKGFDIIDSANFLSKIYKS